jgi:hypothetical protein
VERRGVDHVSVLQLPKPFTEQTFASSSRSKTIIIYQGDDVEIALTPTEFAKGTKPRISVVAIWTCAPGLPRGVKQSTAASTHHLMW